jgi:histone-lysine N-methyltransferase SETD1
MQGHGYGLDQDKPSLQEEDFNGDNSSSFREENRRLLEANSSRYLDHSRSYRRDPGARLEVRRSHIHNWGLFTRTSFSKGDILIEYIGEKVRQAVADRREAHYEQEGVGSCYLFRLDNCEIVDATRTGGMARFMNHCCEPNAVAKVIHCEDEGRDKHIVIIAARDIQVRRFALPPSLLFV